MARFDDHISPPAPTRSRLVTIPPSSRQIGSRFVAIRAPDPLSLARLQTANPIPKGRVVLHCSDQLETPIRVVRERTGISFLLLRTAQHAAKGNPFQIACAPRMHWRSAVFCPCLGPSPWIGKRGTGLAPRDEMSAPPWPMVSRGTQAAEALPNILTPVHPFGQLCWSCTGLLPNYRHPSCTGRYHGTSAMPCSRAAWQHQSIAGEIATSPRSSQGSCSLSRSSLVGKLSSSAKSCPRTLFWLLLPRTSK